MAVIAFPAHFCVSSNPKRCRGFHVQGTAAYDKAEDPIYVLENNIPIDAEHYLEHQVGVVLFCKPVPRQTPPRAQSFSFFVLSLWCCIAPACKN